MLRENRLDNKVKGLYKKEPAKGDKGGRPSNIFRIISTTKGGLVLATTDLNKSRLLLSLAKPY